MEQSPGKRRGGFVWRVVIVALSALTAIASVTASPVAALWIGSQAQGHGVSAMFSIGLVIICLLAFSLTLLRLLIFLNDAYRVACGTQLPDRRVPWLRSMRDSPRDNIPLSAPEKVLLLVLFFTMLAFMVWFLFFAHYNTGVG